MGFVKSIAKGVGRYMFGGVGGLLAHALLKKKKPATIQRPIASESLSAEAEREDELRRRRGAAADMVTGTAGAALPGSGVGRFVASS